VFWLKRPGLKELEERRRLLAICNMAHLIQSVIEGASKTNMADVDESWLLTLQSLGGTEAEVRALPSMAVELLEKMAMERLSLKNVRLICGGQALLDGSVSLQDAGLANGTTLNVVSKSLGAFTALYEFKQSISRGNSKNGIQADYVEERIKAKFEVSDDGSAMVCVEEYVRDESNLDPWSGMGSEENESTRVFSGNVIDYDGQQFTVMFTHLEEKVYDFVFDPHLCSKDIEKPLVAKLDGSTLTIVSADLNSNFRREVLLHTYAGDLENKIGDTWKVTMIA